MQRVLVGLSQLDAPAPLICGGECKVLVNVLVEHRYCLPHRARGQTVRALEKRGLVEKVVILTPEETAQQTLWEEHAPPTHVKLTEQGRRAATLVRLGRRPKR